MSTEAARAAFEEFIYATPYYAHQQPEVPLERDGEGYSDACVHGAWLAWNAAPEPLPRQIAILRRFAELMDEACDWPDTSYELIQLGNLAREVREVLGGD